MLQIVFSLHVCGLGDLFLEDAYGRFGVLHCGGRPECVRRAEFFHARHRVWLCNRCRAEASVYRAMDKGPALTRFLAKRLEQESPGSATVVEYNNALPRPTAATVSYFTLTRYGDIVLRGFAYFGAERTQYGIDRHGYCEWVAGAIGTLLFIALGLPMATWIILHWQTFRGGSLL
jgi:hypothetical protein